MFCMARMCVLHWDLNVFLTSIISQFLLNISTVWGLVWGLLGSVWASWPSWSRLGAILGRPDAIFDVLEFCLIFGSSPEAVCNIRAALAKKAKCRYPPPP